LLQPDHTLTLHGLMHGVGPHGFCSVVHSFLHLATSAGWHTHPVAGGTTGLSGLSVTGKGD
jgi:hypothetical protein